MMQYYSLKDKNIQPKVGRMYRLLVDGDEAVPVILDEIINSNIVLLQYYKVDDPEYIIIDPINVFLEWYGEW